MVIFKNVCNPWMFHARLIGHGSDGMKQASITQLGQPTQPPWYWRFDATRLILAHDMQKTCSRHIAVMRLIQKCVYCHLLAKRRDGKGSSS